ncbi:retrovirus-related pol polyprotein from transposon TNT 1-94 [Tanacetum coccineum]
MHVFIGNFTYIVDFMIVEDISTIIDPRLSQVVLGKPFVKISNMTYDSLEGVVRFTNRIDKIAYKMPHMIEQYNSLSDLEKEHTKSIYLRNEEDKRRGVEYIKEFDLLKWDQQVVSELVKNLFLLKDMNQDSARMVAASTVPMLKPENGATLPKTTNVEGVVTVMPITTVEEKAQRRLEVRARSTLMMGIPNEHQLKFNSIKDAKKLLEVVEKRFGGNVATRKTQRNFLNQQYENFIAPSSEMPDQIFDMLQKLVSQLELLDEKLSQEDVNRKLLKSLSPEWNTHAVVWRNKADLDTMSMDDLYKNLKDLQQIHPDDMEEMDLRWQMAMLTIRSRRVLKNIGKKLTVNGNETIGFDKSKVECYNCHKRGHFARECRAPRNQDNKNKESSRRSVPVEISTSTALVSCDGLGGYD